MLIYVVLTLLLVHCRSQSVPTTCDDCTCNNPIVDCRNVNAVCQIKGDFIDCSLKKLNASFSTEPKKWTIGQATELDFEHNFIGRVVPYPALNITTINLRYNVIVEVDDLAFSKLAKLEDLDLSYNELSEMKPEVFQGPYSAVEFEPLNIASLNLSYNQFSYLDQNLFEHLPRLQRLMLQGNPLADGNGKLAGSTVVAIAGSAPRLRLLDLSETGLSSLPPTFLRNLGELEELVLMHNNFVRLPADELSFAPSLQIINFNYNPITVISSEHPFPRMPTVTQLHISHMPQLLRIEPRALQGLTGLRYLSCSNNEYLEYVSGDALAAPNLIRLELHDNSLHYLPEDLVPHWENLTTLHILGNRWSCDCDNQWLISRLIPKMKNSSEGLICSQPEEMKGAQMQKLAERKYDMRCLDDYGAHPGQDGSFLVATFVIIVIALVVIGAILLFRRGRWRKGQPIDYTAIYQQHIRDDYGT